MVIDEMVIRVRKSMLGLLPEDQEDALNGEFLGEPEALEWIRTVELQLMTDRLAMRLAPEEAEAFDSYFLESTDRQVAYNQFRAEHVAFAQAVREAYEQRRGLSGWADWISRECPTLEAIQKRVLSQGEGLRWFDAMLPAPSFAGSFADQDPAPFEKEESFDGGLCVRLEEIHRTEVHIVASAPKSKGMEAIEILLAGSNGKSISVSLELSGTGEFVAGRAVIGTSANLRELLGREVVLIVEPPSAVSEFAPE
jgi:hypothetical protein